MKQPVNTLNGCWRFFLRLFQVAPALVGGSHLGLGWWVGTAEPKAAWKITRR